MTNAAPQMQERPTDLRQTNDHVLVLLDPRSLEGEVGLHQTPTALDGNAIVTLAVWVQGECRASLTALATSTGSSLEDAAWRYLDTAASRLRMQPGHLTHLVIADQDLGLGLTRWVAQNDITAVVLPHSLTSQASALETRITLLSGLPVVVAGRQHQRPATQKRDVRGERGSNPPALFSSPIPT